MGLATIEEALLSIVPPLEKAGKLPTNLSTTQVFEDTAKEISTHIKGGRFDQAEPLLWLLDTAESSATKFETEGKWKDACGLFVLLCNTCDKIDAAEEYVTQAEEAMGLFYERHFMFLTKSTDSTRGAEDTLDLLRATLDDRDVRTRRLAKWEAHLANWKPDTDHLMGADLNARNSLKRTPLILASIAGVYVFFYILRAISESGS